MAELVIQLLEVVDIEHHDGYLRAIAVGALHLFRDTQLEEATVEDAGQAVKVIELPRFFEVAGVEDSAGADVCHCFERGKIIRSECVRLRAFEHQRSQFFAEEEQWHADLRFRKKTGSAGARK